MSAFPADYNFPQGPQLGGSEVFTTLEVTKTTVPTATTTERDNLSPQPVVGQVLYNLDTDKLNLFTTSGWEEVTSA